MEFGSKSHTECTRTHIHPQMERKKGRGGEEKGRRMPQMERGVGGDAGSGAGSGGDKTSLLPIPDSSANVTFKL